ncbi:hypothetical protein [Methylorubrum thiocyanatum]|uniref:hypothetical protein n=1 Tax=Methylorubrum thiocyanatum TaxID=47958 RepID=UPI0035C8290A
MKKTDRAAKDAGAIMDRRTRGRLALEIVPTKARLRLTRLLRASVKAGDGENAHQIEVIRINQIVNLANTVQGRPIYRLELSDWDYEPADYAWHFAELELAMRRPDTAELFEILVDLVEQVGLSVADINGILEAEGVGARLTRDDDRLSIHLVELNDAPETEPAPGEHVNVRGLIERMDRALQDGDWSLVLHAGASVFESVAKDVVQNPAVQHRSLGSWFSAYRKVSKLSAPLLDAAEAIFQRRNVEPLAGHGSIELTGVTEAEAIQIRELSIAIVRMERLLARVESAELPTTKRSKRTQPIDRRKGVPAAVSGTGKSKQAEVVSKPKLKHKSKLKLHKSKSKKA